MQPRSTEVDELRDLLTVSRRAVRTVSTIILTLLASMAGRTSGGGRRPGLIGPMD
jgi:hypothetical protein